jgi:hypothetical protein
MWMKISTLIMKRFRNSSGLDANQRGQGGIIFQAGN